MMRLDEILNLLRTNPSETSVRNNQIDPLQQRQEEREYLERFFKADHVIGYEEEE
jgi:hypothetical protein